MNNSVADNVVSITDRPFSTLSKQLLESREAYDLAPFLYAADQRLGRAPIGLPYDYLTFAQRESYVGRAAIAVRLGDPIKAIAVAEHAALGMVRDVTERMRTKELGADAPEAALELLHWRRLAKVAVMRGLEYLSGVARINMTDAEGR